MMIARGIRWSVVKSLPEVAKLEARKAQTPISAVFAKCRNLNCCVLCRPVSLTARRLEADVSDANHDNLEGQDTLGDAGSGKSLEAIRQSLYWRKRENPKDRTRSIPLELSMAYMESPAYKETYGDDKVWERYRRNFAKGRTYRRTRRTCIEDGFLTTSNPCPICRDEYFVVDYRNVKLISQFMEDYTGRVLTAKGTGVCQHQWVQIRVALEKAKDHGYLDLDPPFIEYDYGKYRPSAASGETLTDTNATEQSSA